MKFNEIILAMGISLFALPCCRNKQVEAPQSSTPPGEYFSVTEEVEKASSRGPSVDFPPISGTAYAEVIGVHELLAREYWLASKAQIISKEPNFKTKVRNIEVISTLASGSEINSEVVSYLVADGLSGTIDVSASEEGVREAIFTPGRMGSVLRNTKVILEKLE